MLDFFTGTKVTTKNLNSFIESINKYKYCHIKSNNSYLPRLYRINKLGNNQYRLTDYIFKDNQMVVGKTTKSMDKSELVFCLNCRCIFS